MGWSIGYDPSWEQWRLENPEKVEAMKIMIVVDEIIERRCEDV